MSLSFERLREVIACWKASYGLDKTPHELHAFWQAGAPAGAVLALRAAVQRIERLEAWIEGDCRCPCCDEVRKCMDECTFADDCPNEASRMNFAREVLFGRGDDA